MPAVFMAWTYTGPVFVGTTSASSGPADSRSGPGLTNPALAVVPRDSSGNYFRLAFSPFSAVIRETIHTLAPILSPASFCSTHSPLYLSVYLSIYLSIYLERERERERDRDRDRETERDRERERSKVQVSGYS